MREITNQLELDLPINSLFFIKILDFQAFDIFEDELFSVKIENSSTFQGFNREKER